MEPSGGNLCQRAEYRSCTGEPGNKTSKYPGRERKFIDFQSSGERMERAQTVMRASRGSISLWQT